MNLLGLSILSAVIVIVLVAPRRWALWGVMVGVLYLTQGQQIPVLGFNMYALRFVELAGFIRVMSRKEFSFSRLNIIDKALLQLYVYTSVVYVIRASDGIAYQVGVAIDAFLCYFLFRGLIKVVGDLQWFLKAFLLLLIPYTGLLLVESFTHNNLFSSMGGIDFGGWLRDGKLRCQGSFRHASLLGTLGASFLPLYIGTAWNKADRATAVVGAGLCLVVVWASNSGGPASCVAVGAVGWLLWRLRLNMKLFRRCVAAALILLALIMKAPIWYLLARVSSITGGDGYHRAYLIDSAYHSLGHWGLFGMNLLETRNWFAYELSTTGVADITNVFISFGLTAGVVAIILLVRLLVRAFSCVGKALKEVRSWSNDTGSIEPLFWGLGVMLTVHIFNWLGITYFDQTYAIWFMQLAALSSITSSVTDTKGVEVSNESDLSKRGTGATVIDGILTAQ